MGAENLAPTGIQSPNCPACSESLYHLCYPGPLHDSSSKKNTSSIHTTKLCYKKQQICVLQVKVGTDDCNVIYVCFLQFKYLLNPFGREFYLSNM